MRVTVNLLDKSRKQRCLYVNLVDRILTTCYEENGFAIASFKYFLGYDSDFRVKPAGTTAAFDGSPASQRAASPSAQNLPNHEFRKGFGDSAGPDRA